MKVKDAIVQLQRLLYQSGGRADDLDLVVPVYAPGSLGGTPKVAVGHLQAGIDWDSGVVLAVPVGQLTQLGPDDVAAILESVRKGQSWHVYQREKKLREQIAALRAEVARLEQAEADADRYRTLLTHARSVHLTSADLTSMDGLSERLDAIRGWKP